MTTADGGADRAEVAGPVGRPGAVCAGGGRPHDADDAVSWLGGRLGGWVVYNRVETTNRKQPQTNQPNQTKRNKTEPHRHQHPKVLRPLPRLDGAARQDLPAPGTGAAQPRPRGGAFVCQCRLQFAYLINQRVRLPWHQITKATKRRRLHAPRLCSSTPPPPAQVADYRADPLCVSGPTRIRTAFQYSKVRAVPPPFPRRLRLPSSPHARRNQQTDPKPAISPGCITPHVHTNQTTTKTHTPNNRPPKGHGRPAAVRRPDHAAGLLRAPQGRPGRALGGGGGRFVFTNVLRSICGICVRIWHQCVVCRPLLGCLILSTRYQPCSDQLLHRI
jgi:hypothetical protein